jgi:anthranilate synthase component 2
MPKTATMNNILVIDNYDSFTYNLVHAIEALTEQKVTVRRNDKISLDEVDGFEFIILSPGPGLPNEAGILKDVIKTFARDKKILGVCLGLQAIAEVFGASLMNLKQVYHGIKSTILQTEYSSVLFRDIPKQFDAGRYHSWVIDPETIPETLKISCVDENQVIMGIEHEEYPVYGVQFHPESIMTPTGDKILSNFLYNS